MERLRASEDAARAASAVLEARVEDLSSALREGQARAKRDAEAEVAAEAREAMDILRHQLDDLRREMDKTKRDKWRSDQARSDHPRSDHARNRGVGVGTVAHEMTEHPGESAVSPRGDASGKMEEGEGAVDVVAQRIGSVVLEGEFQRLRAKYEKAKGRIAALEEQVVASRRASVHARREFQV